MKTYTKKTWEEEDEDGHDQETKIVCNERRHLRDSSGNMNKKRRFYAHTLRERERERERITNHLELREDNQSCSDL